MLADDFVFNITTKYQDRKDRDRNKVFKDDLMNFVDICPEEHLQDIYEHIPTFHKYSTPFDVFELKKYAASKGYIKKSSVNRKQRLFYECKGFTQIREEKLEDGRIKKHYDHISCSTRYSYRSTGCPNCHSTSANVILWDSLEAFQDDVIEVKEDCHKCINFSLDHMVNLETDTHGPTCHNYAEKDYPSKECGTCKCKVCCKEYGEYMRNPGKYVDNIKKTGTDPLYWIGKNLVVSMHIRDESRLTAPQKKGEKFDKPQFFGVNIEELAKSKRVKW